MIIKVKDGTVNETANKQKMHPTRRKVIDIMRGEDTKDTFGWTPESEKKELEEAPEKFSLLDEVKTPTFCPRCERLMRKIDVKMWRRTSHCFTCQQDFEHKLRVNNMYSLWEKMKVFQNEISILRDAREKFTEAYDSMKPESEFVSSTGHITKFEFLGNWEEVREDIQKQIDDIDAVLPEARKELQLIEQQLQEMGYEKLLEDFAKNS